MLKSANTAKLFHVWPRQEFDQFVHRRTLHLLSVLRETGTSLDWNLLGLEPPCWRRRTKDDLTLRLLQRRGKPKEV